MMIEYLKGKIIRKSVGAVTLECAQVGYGLAVSLNTYASLPETGDELSLWVYTRVKEDGIFLFGFKEWQERQIFALLLQMNGVGPKVALAMLSTISMEELKQAAADKEFEVLLAVPGIGKKTAEKIILELHNNLEKFPSMLPVHSTCYQSKKALPLQLDEDAAGGNEVYLDLVSALKNLGLKDKEAKDRVDRVMKENDQLEFTVLLKEALKRLKPETSVKKNKPLATELF